MVLVGLEHLLALVEGTAFEGKMVVNERGAVFGPVSTQHRDLEADGISCADDYKGNALAAMLGAGRIAIRFHKAFTDEDVSPSTYLTETETSEREHPHVETRRSSTFAGR